MTFSTDQIKNIGELTARDLPLAGGKAATLDSLMRAGISVPPGFVLLSSAFEDFVAKAGLSPRLIAYREAVASQDVEKARALSEEIHKLILRAHIPTQLSITITAHMNTLGTQFVAVRSSAVSEDGTRATWAGQLDSFLNTDERTLPENVKKCWASLFGVRANFYRLRQDALYPSTSMGVIVQEMVPSEVSGVAFSAHPITFDRGIVLIEAGFGLGEAVVSGRITPDSYTISKQTRAILAKEVAYQQSLMQMAETGGNVWRDLDRADGERQKLDDHAIQELTDLVCAVEEHQGYPVDVEWALSKDRLYVLQSRAITTLE